MQWDSIFELALATLVIFGLFAALAYVSDRIVERSEKR